MEYKIGDIVELKKQHPCGSKIWEITRVGIDFKLKCMRMQSCNNGRKAKNTKNDKKESRGIDFEKKYWLKNNEYYIDYNYISNIF